MSDFLKKLGDVADEEPVEEQSFEGEDEFIEEIDQVLIKLAAAACDEIKKLLERKVNNNEFVTSKGKRIASIDYKLSGARGIYRNRDMNYTESVLSMSVNDHIYGFMASFIRKYDPKLLEKYRVKCYEYESTNYIEVGIIDVKYEEKKLINVLNFRDCKIKSVHTISDNHFTQTFYSALADNLRDEGLTFSFSLLFSELSYDYKKGKYKKYKEVPIIPGQPLKAEVRHTSKSQPIDRAGNEMIWEKTVHVEATF